VASLSFFVSGTPKSMQVGKSIRVPRKGGGWQQFQERRNSDWGAVVAHVGAQHAPERPWTGRIVFVTRFLLPKPASAPKRRTIYPTKRPDIRNLTNKIEDVFNGVLWVDDSQIVRWEQAKDYATDGRAGLYIEVHALDPQEAHAEIPAEAARA